MSDAPDKDQQTEAPTPKRKTDAMREGDVLQSRELAVAVVMLAGAAWVALVGQAFVDGCAQLLRHGLVLSPADVADFDPLRRLALLLQPVFMPLASLFLMCLIAAVAGPAILGSAGFRGSAMAFKPGRIDPVQGLKRMFGLHGLTELGKALAKVLLLGAIGIWLVRGQLRGMPGLAAQDLTAAMGDMGRMIRWVVMVLCGGLLLIAGVDVPVQLWRRNARLRMTRQQVKEEMRQSEGAPELKQAQRQRQHELLTGSARKAVTEATVVLMNPTHFAVALRYRPGVDAAPMVVARGRGDVALAIRSLASEEGVPMLEYPQLTRAIYFTSRAGQVISEDLFHAVATVLAFVFRLEQSMADRSAPPEVTVPEMRQYDEHGGRRFHR